MLIRIAVILFLSVNVFAGDFVNSWKRGQTKSYQYKIQTILPKETTNYMTLTVTREDTEKPDFTVTQKIDIPDQKIIITARDKYQGDDLQLTVSENWINFPKEMATRMGTDTVHITATRKGDSMIISSNSQIVPEQNFMADKLITGTGSLFTSRAMDFREGQTAGYNFVNFIQLSGKPYEPIAVQDSVVGRDTVEIALGKFECVKVRNQVPNIYSYTYYTADARHLPVKVELINPQDNQTVQILTLVKTE